MNDVIKMAREAGLHSAVLLHLYGGREAALTDSECDELRRLERFFHAAYAAGAAAERERNAQIADAHASVEGIAQLIAAEIRSDK